VLNELKSLLALLIVVAVGITFFSLVAYLIAPVWTQCEWYALKYNTVKEAVHVSSKPHDCDFFRAPLGVKSCHYKKEIQVEPWHPDSTMTYFQSNVRGPNHSDAFASIPGESVVNPHTNVFIIWNKVRDY
jgi:hypothetical protein